MFDNIEIEFSYTLGADKKNVSFVNSYIDKDFKAVLKVNKIQCKEILELSIVPNAELVIEELNIKIPYYFKENHKIFVNGYQSWTDSREFFLDERMKTISKLAGPVMKKYQFHKYGDYTFKKYSGKRGIFHGYTYSYIRDGKFLDLLGSLSERSGFTIYEYFTKKNEIVISKECNGLLINSEYKAFDIFHENGSEAEVFDSYFEAMNITKPKYKPSTGWTSWYNYYQDINQEIILENLNNFSKYGKKIETFQIDDGYQTAVGDWLSVNKTKFPNGMKYIAEDIKKAGCKSGIWLAPFVCETNSNIFKEKKNWLLRDESGNPVMAGSNWSGFYALDLYNTEVQEYIKNVFSVILNDWGYDMVKLDFLYAVCLIPRKDKTRGQIMTEAMEFLRKCVGDKIILGCGVPLGPAFGLVDYCRIGCDISLDWDDKFYMRKLHRERISTFNSIRNSIGRHHLDGRSFLNDPDVFLLREDNITLNKTQKETLAFVNNLFGSLLFTSDNLNKYNDEQFSVFDKTMKLRNRFIEKVESDKDGLIEVVYRDEEKKYLALINLSNSQIDYLNSQVKINERILPYKSNIYEI